MQILPIKRRHCADAEIGAVNEAESNTHSNDEGRYIKLL